jgi:hypothetical protein
MARHVKLGRRISVDAHFHLSEKPWKNGELTPFFPDLGMAKQ